MSPNMKGRSLLTLEEFSAPEVGYLLESAIDFKRLKRNGVYPRNLANKNFVLIFLKPSCRTRASFVVAASDEGAHLEIFSKDDIRFGIKESVKDIARCLGRLFDGIAFRGYSHDLVRCLAEHAGVPVWNGLCDTYHPTQVLADFMTIKEEFGRVKGVKVAYVGDGRNNMVTSLMVGAAKMGVDLRVVAPQGLLPAPDLVKRILARKESAPAAITVTTDLDEGLRGCDVVYGDVWVSMGEEGLVRERSQLLKPYKVTKGVMARTRNSESIYMHCLPALHDLDTDAARDNPDILEVDDDVFEGPQSRVFDQAENRMHAVKALMVATV
jgi:ornithine carbamoyltransferase